MKVLRGITLSVGCLLAGGKMSFEIHASRAGVIYTNASKSFVDSGLIKKIRDKITKKMKWFVALILVYWAVKKLWAPVWAPDRLIRFLLKKRCTERIGSTLVLWYATRYVRTVRTFAKGMPFLEWVASEDTDILVKIVNIMYENKQLKYQYETEAKCLLEIIFKTHESLLEGVKTKIIGDIKGIREGLKRVHWNKLILKENDDGFSLFYWLAYLFVNKKLSYDDFCGLRLKEDPSEYPEPVQHSESEGQIEMVIMLLYAPNVLILLCEGDDIKKSRFCKEAEYTFKQLRPNSNRYFTTYHRFFYSKSKSLLCNNDKPTGDPGFPPQFTEHLRQIA